MPTKAQKQLTAAYDLVSQGADLKNDYLQKLTKNEIEGLISHAEKHNNQRFINHIKTLPLSAWAKPENTKSRSSRKNRKNKLQKTEPTTDETASSRYFSERAKYAGLSIRTVSGGLPSLGKRR